MPSPVPQGKPKPHPQQPPHQPPAQQPQQAQQPAQPQKPPEPSISVTEPLRADHNKVRELVGELRAHLDQFNLAGLRRTAKSLKAFLSTHSLKEETALFLIGMKSLRADNEKLPELIREHHEVEDQLGMLLHKLYSPQLTNTEDAIRSLVVSIVESIEEHLEDEDKLVFPAFEQILDNQTKRLILERIRRVSGSPEEEILGDDEGELPGEPDSGVLPDVKFTA